MKLQFNLSKKQIGKDIALIIAGAISSVIVLMLLIVLLAKLGINYPQGSSFIYILLSWFCLSFLVISYFSNKKFVNVINCTNVDVKTRNILGRMSIIDLNRYYFQPNYQISVDTNQLIGRNIELRQKSDDQCVGYLFTNLPDHIFIQILDYYKLDASPMEKREIKKLPLDKHHRDYKYVSTAIMAFPFVCLIIGGLGALSENKILFGISMFVIGVIGIFYAVYNISQILKRKDDFSNND